MSTLSCTTDVATRRFGTEQDTPTPPIATQFGTVILATQDQKGGEPVRGFEPDNAFHVAVLVAPAAALRQLTCDTEEDKKTLDTLVAGAMATPRVVIVTKFDELPPPPQSTRPTALPQSPSTAVVAADTVPSAINRASANWWQAKLFCSEYRTEVAAPVLGGGVRVVPLDTPVLDATKESDPRQLDGRAMGMLLERATDTLLAVLDAVREQVAEKVKRHGT